MTNSTPSLELNDGHRIPQLGFGVFLVPPGDTAEVVQKALATGYRHIDTAAAYGNEAGVAAGIARSGLPRDRVFVTTKLPNSHHGYEAAQRAIDSSLEQLGFDHVDLYLIHWPRPADDRYVETWRALTEFKSDGRARSIGVSNFTIDHLERIIAETGQTPTVNQIELHPRLVQAELRCFHAHHSIATEAWSPLGRARLLDDPAIELIARARGRTPAQVILRWHIQLGNIVIPKTVTPERIEENFNVFDFELDDGEMHAIEQIDAGQRFGPDPVRFS
jgi:2,5-diketo-D-gluconate reductase A